MHIADRSLKFQAGSAGLKAFRFCMPAQAPADPTRRGLWFNETFGRRMVPSTITDRDVEPDAKFRAIMPHQEMLAEVASNGLGLTGEWVIVTSQGTIVPIDDGLGRFADCRHAVGGCTARRGGADAVLAGGSGELGRRAESGAVRELHCSISSPRSIRSPIGVRLDT